jgi:hypothetical protein
LPFRPPVLFPLQLIQKLRIHRRLAELGTRERHVARRPPSGQQNPENDVSVLRARTYPAIQDDVCLEPRCHCDGYKVFINYLTCILFKSEGHKYN